ncbi:hypothetical protein DIX60_00940 [Streptococcus iniae]|uniref:hypothetical protein n=1 Tax=Streptococcus iniae TaxID=1346 RepID=UPI0008DA02D9|nr:hypothetical protein [Streptococcus iniae]OHX27074.1 hypothetical protein BKX95_07165 [Streptococcus iniae]RLV28668.1 hypothetical protein DIX60_00940 [Streptococcus iniae]
MKDLKKLKRQELLEIMLEQQVMIEQQESEIASLKREIKSRKIQINNAGSIAEAALALNGIFQVAQQAADDYLESIRALKGEEGES